MSRNNSKSTRTKGYKPKLYELVRERKKRLNKLVEQLKERKNTQRDRGMGG